ncbi:MAG: phage major capsid protein [Dehalococcoidia bacterium]|nr:MAG: phage major capsid protein [Dehalococcoidia bacterium]
MALTLAEAAKLSNDILLVGVIETIVYDSPILQALPFIEIVGNGLTYNQENQPATAAFYNVGDTWIESTPTFTQKTATLKILGGDADVDNFLKATRSNIQDLEAAIVQLKAKAVQQKFEDTFINGDTSVDTKSFDGIDKLCDANQTLSMGVDGGTLTLEKLDELIDLIKGGKPEMLLMSRRSRRKLTALSRASGGILVTDRNQFGQMVEYYDAVPIGVSDWIADDQTVGTSTDCSTIYALHFGEGAVAGLTSPGGLQVEQVGSLESRDASRTRVKWYVSAALFNTIKLAKLIGVRD